MQYGYLYIIRNSFNDKVYIGKTYADVDTRFKQHIAMQNSGSCSGRKLYRAIRKYGPNSFCSSEIGRFEQGVLEQKEAEYIAIYDQYKNGYNMSIGGDGLPYLNLSGDEVVQQYLFSKSVSGVADFFNVSAKTIQKMLKQNGFVNFERNKMQSVEVYLVEDSLYFPQLADAANYACEQYGVNYTQAYASISRCLSGVRQQYKAKTWIKLS